MGTVEETVEGTAERTVEGTVEGNVAWAVSAAFVVQIVASFGGKRCLLANWGPAFVGVADKLADCKGYSGRSAAQPGFLLEAGCQKHSHRQRNDNFAFSFNIIIIW